MNRRHLALFLSGYAALVLIAPLGYVLPTFVPLPDLVLLVTLYLAVAVKGSPSAGLACAVGLGYLADLFSGAPRGLYSLTLGITYFVVRGLSARLYLRGKLSQMLVAGVVSLGTSLILVGLEVALNPHATWAMLHPAPGSALATAVVAPPVFWLLWNLDRKMAPEISFEGVFR